MKDNDKRRREEFASVKGQSLHFQEDSATDGREDKSEERDGSDKRRLSDKSMEKLKNSLQ